MRSEKPRVELKKDGIHVLTVCPGYVRTAFGENAVRGNEQEKVRPIQCAGSLPNASPERRCEGT